MTVIKSQNNNFQLLFFKVGDGNGCLIKCPDDTVVVVDFGSNYQVSPEQLEKIRQDISTNAKSNKIRALVMSSPERSRYNKINSIFKDYMIENVYYSCRVDASKSEYPLENYMDQGVATSISHKNTGSPLLNEVTINHQSQTIFCCPFNYKYGQENFKEEKINNSKVVICQDTDSNRWEVSIVAGNVKSKYPHEKRIKDAGSLVTYIRMDGHKALLLGKASDETQEFLKARHPDIMQNMIDYPEASYKLLFYPDEIQDTTKVTQDEDMKMILGIINLEEDDGEGGK